MPKVEDCIQMSGLTEEEITAIAEHERLPAFAAAELGQHLLECPHGLRRITTIIEDSIVVARKTGDTVNTGKLRRVLRRFRQKHPGSIANPPVPERRDPERDVDT